MSPDTNVTTGPTAIARQTIKIWMSDSVRYRLIAGPYRTPRVRLGAVLTCLVRDRDVVVTGLTDARIPWPLGRPRGGRRPGIVVTEKLARALATESNQAVAYWWGLSFHTVSKWRKALGVRRATPGTSLLHLEAWKEINTPELKRLRAERAYTPEAIAKRAAKISAALKGKPFFDRTGLKATAKQRKAQSKRLKGKPTPMNERPWTRAEVRLLNKLPPAEVARRTGRSVQAVYLKRWKLRLGRQITILPT